MKKTISLAVLLCLPEMLYAHQDLANGSGLIAGLSHPVLGFDHFLAMISVGILSAQIGGKAIWTVPTAFVGVMLLGGMLGIYGVPLFSVELGIAFSVFALGIALAAEKKLPWVFALLFVSIFALFHGHAHGTEMPSIAQPALYALGFVLGTASIHLFGVMIGLFAQMNARSAEFLRFVGASIAGIGFHLLIA